MLNVWNKWNKHAKEESTDDAFQKDRVATIIRVHYQIRLQTQFNQNEDGKVKLAKVGMKLEKKRCLRYLFVNDLITVEEHGELLVFLRYS